MLERFANHLSSKLDPYRISIFKLGVFSTPLIFSLGFVALKLRSKGWYKRLVIIEDGPIEYLTSLAYLVAFLIGLSIAVQFYRQRQPVYGVLYTLLSIGFLFICLEEISWGQRIFDLQTPEFFRAYNQQEETNIHNFASRYLLHGAYILIGVYGVFAFLVIPKRITTRFKTVIDLLVPNWFLILYFLPVLALYLYYDYLSPVFVALLGERFGWAGTGCKNCFIVGKDQEPVEFILSLGFLLFVGLNKWRQALGRFDRFGSKKVLNVNEERLLNQHLDLGKN